jgi:hypothetical protein
VARFTQEARAAAGLSHPNIVAVFDSGSEVGELVISPEPSNGPCTELGTGWRTRPARRGMGWTRWVVVGVGRTVDGVVVGVGRTVDGVGVGVDRTVDGEGVGVVGAGAATAVPVPNRSVTQYPFSTHTPTPTRV